MQNLMDYLHYWILGYLVLFFTIYIFERTIKILFDDVKAWFWCYLRKWISEWECLEYLLWL